MSNPDFDLAILPANLRRTLMRHAPDYFIRSEAERERRRAEWSVNRPDELMDQIRQDILSGNDDPDAEMSERELTEINTQSLMLTGVGADFFYWNERLGEDETALRWETIGAYQRSSHDAQQELIAQDTQNYEKKPYKGHVYADWARYLGPDHKVRYAVLYDLAHYVYSQMEDRQYQVMQELIPHDFVNGPNHGRQAGDDLFELDLRLDADGYEALYWALSDAATAIVSQHIEEMTERFAPTPERVWILPSENIANDPQGVIVIFSNAAAMDRIRTRHFLADCETYAGSMNDLTELVVAEVARFEEKLRARHAELAPDHPKDLIPFQPQTKTFASGEIMDVLDEASGDS